MSDSIFIGTDTDGKRQNLLFKLANRHGLVAGATGTGKTVTLQILTEGFSKAGIPVFAADVKGDLSGISQAGSTTHKLHDKLISRAEKIGLEDYNYAAMPTIFWDFLGKQGHPVRTTISEMGPTLLARLMQLNETQEGILNIAFALSDDEKMLLLDVKDLRSLLNYISDNRSDISRRYGNVTSQSIAAIQRKILVLERSGGERYFGEPALKLADLMRVDANGKGVVSILAADDLVNLPSVYPTFLLWLLSELFEDLPEVGNPDKPKMIFFFDEAHLLFDDAPKALIDKIEQFARLIRSKGVGIYFVTQNPMDIPDSVLGQLGNRIQHALRAYTPKEQKAVRAAASSFRENPKLDTEDVITDLGVGEALVSLLDAKGVPGIVGRTMIRPPASRLGPATPTEREAVLADSPVKGIYDKPVDRESAYEILEAKTEADAKAAAKAEAAAEKAKKKSKAKAKTPAKRKTRKKQNQIMKEVKYEAKLMFRRGLRSAIRGILGSITRR
ncbi:helicase HerA-like domain-containing protein [Litorimonas sp. RW-G-Af-16]|uniref:helicase HerA-like domain-containing protein n=1 Tax=Litorimonas sp. RW-G-Af-16 TaxID=3241168 RepID=UPI00390C4FB9